MFILPRFPFPPLTVNALYNPLINGMSKFSFCYVCINATFSIFPFSSVTCPFTVSRFCVNLSVYSPTTGNGILHFHFFEYNREIFRAGNFSNIMQSFHRPFPTIFFNVKHEHNQQIYFLKRFLSFSMNYKLFLWKQFYRRCLLIFQASCCVATNCWKFFHLRFFFLNIHFRPFISSFLCS